MRLIVAVVALLLATCGPAVAPSPTPAPPPLLVVELKYRVLDQIGRPWYCDPDFYPVARADEKDLARERLPEMQADAETYAAILRHNGLAPGAALTEDQLLAVYRDWKQLRALPLERAGGAYRFSVRVEKGAGGGQSEQVEGTIDAFGRISVSKRTSVGPPICPICLADTTLIATPDGPVPVTELRRGMLVWTEDVSGRRVAAPVLELAGMKAPSGHEVLRLRLADGRAVIASPGHPAADGRPLGSMRVGDMLDGARVLSIERLPYLGRTHDLLPAGTMGIYWADGVRLRSTVAGR